MKNWLWTLLAGALVALSFAGTAQAQAPKVNVLVFHGPKDATSDAGVAAIKTLGAQNGFGVDEAAASALTDDNLAKYRALVFLNTAGDLLDADQESAVQRFVEGGNGFLGIGSAAQGESGSFFDGLIGARPSGSGSSGEKLVVPGDRVHPATRDLPLKWTRSDDWYQWTSRVTGKVHVVARYRGTTAPAGDATEANDNDTPISWCRDYRGGRSFYTGMGRTAASYGEPDFNKHLLGALMWTSGLTRANCKATIDASYKGTKIMSAGPESTGLVTSGESHGIATASNGWMLYIGRGDCRTDAERGALIPGSAPFGRVFDHSDPRVGIGCGTVHIFDPSRYTGQENSGVTLAGKLAVYGDGGQGGERTDQDNHKMEYGLLGIAPSPDFAQTGHIYLQYFPSFDERSTPPGLPIERRISKLSRPRISRFTIDLQTKKLDLKSEVRIFEYDAQIYSCCHVGGGMGFDSKGNLYVTTGDTNSSQGSHGYAGNNPKAKCPMGTQPYAPSSANCGPESFSYQDARRTAGNTNDYNGKMLRIKPDPGIPDGTQPPVGHALGGTYALPTKDDPNGPNLFDGKEDGGGKTKPEIYAMGLRNPSRLSIDPKTDVPYTAWVGPDAGAPSQTEGPSTYENAAQVSHAGNYGWPYCMGNKQAYRDRFDTDALRTDNGGAAGGYVSGGPADATTNGWYDCNNLRNDSPNNTGLVVFPHQTGTGADAGTVRGNNLWYSRGNPSNANGCPDFPREGGNGAPNYGASNPVQLCPYAHNNGMTIMDGPVYRYNANATDNSKRWPEYWDGRWFLHNNGGPSIKHGLLLDPATADKGGLPIYADSLRDTLSWSDGSYMDSKFGTDGALYVQTYDGFFRANPGVSIYRYDYVGGPPTPGAAPKGVPIGGNKVRYSSAGSGGVSYKWEFDDGQTSTDPNPDHQYATSGRHTAKLTVTYGDGGTDANAVDVDVLAQADETPPTTTASFSPAQPGDGGTYTRPVTVTLTATDAAGGSGVEKIEYRLNGGEYQTYTAPITRSQPGAYKIEFRATDRTGNVEPAKSVSFTIVVADNCKTNLNDEFNGPDLAKWTILRDTPSARSFVNGRLRMLVRNGDMISNQATARNVLLKDAPQGTWQATIKLDVSTLTNEGEQAGFVLWSRENPNTFAKITYISKGSSQQWEWVATRNNNAQISAGGSIPARPTDVYLRLTANGAGTYIAEGSLDGESWTQISSPITDVGDPKAMKLGIKVSDNADTTNYAGFDYFRVDCSDKLAPASSAAVSPGTPDGDFSWYTKSPQVTLTADDGAGDGVAKIEYSIDGGERRTYEGPFTVDGVGEHEVSYFATDKAGNAETAKKLGFRVDGAAPSTSATTVVDEAAQSARVTLDAADGAKGSGVMLTEYRVDGGPWQTYMATDKATDERILAGSAASLAQWKQAGSGHFDLLHDGSGGITPVDGLGMLWYPKPYGDYKLKLQFREGASGTTSSNGGVFIRFPDPEQKPRVDDCAKTGPAANDPAWVAIYCGFEVQLYDGTGGETRKTGSIYTFDNNTIGEIGPKKPRGEWEDYEIDVVGRHFTIRRNGTVIKEFENTPGRPSDRGGDPSTSLRQFAQGYIGLQNHGGADTMQYRNVRVEDLSPGAPVAVAPKPFAVSGKGPHTIEVRSTDAAGNVEAKKTFDLEIGALTPPGSSDGSTVVSLVPQNPAGPLLPPMIDTPASATLGKVTARIARATFAKRGLSVPIACTGAMDGTAKLTVASSIAKRLKLSRTTLAGQSVKCYGPHSIQVSLKPSSALAKQLARKGGPKSVTLTLTVEMRDFGRAPQTIVKSVTLKR